MPSSLRTCRCASVAPASNAAWVDSTCSAIVIGTAGLFSFFGSEPVMATVMMQGVVADIGAVPFVQTSKNTVSSSPCSRNSIR